MYKGGKYLGRKPIEIDGRTIKQNDIVKEMPEQEAKNRVGFEPVYSEQIKKLKKERSDG